MNDSCTECLLPHHSGDAPLWHLSMTTIDGGLLQWQQDFHGPRAASFRAFGLKRNLNFGVRMNLTSGSPLSSARSTSGSSIFLASTSDTGLINDSTGILSVWVESNTSWLCTGQARRTHGMREPNLPGTANDALHSLQGPRLSDESVGR